MRRLFSQLLALNQSRAVFDLIIDVPTSPAAPLTLSLTRGKWAKRSQPVQVLTQLLVPTVTGIGSYYLKLLAPPPLARSSCSLTDLLLIQYSHLQITPVLNTNTQAIPYQPKAPTQLISWPHM